MSTEEISVDGLPGPWQAWGEGTDGLWLAPLHLPGLQLDAAVQAGYCVTQGFALVPHKALTRHVEAGDEPEPLF